MYDVVYIFVLLPPHLNELHATHWHECRDLLDYLLLRDGGLQVFREQVGFVVAIVHGDDQIEDQFLTHEQLIRPQGRICTLLRVVLNEGEGFLVHLVHIMRDLQGLDATER